MPNPNLSQNEQKAFDINTRRGLSRRGVFFGFMVVLVGVFFLATGCGCSTPTVGSTNNVSNFNLQNLEQFAVNNILSGETASAFGGDGENVNSDIPFRELSTTPTDRFGKSSTESYTYLQNLTSVARITNNWNTENETYKLNDRLGNFTDANGTRRIFYYSSVARAFWNLDGAVSGKDNEYQNYTSNNRFNGEGNIGLLSINSKLSSSGSLEALDGNSNLIIDNGSTDQYQRRLSYEKDDSDKNANGPAFEANDFAFGGVTLAFAMVSKTNVKETQAEPGSSSAFYYLMNFQVNRAELDVNTGRLIKDFDKNNVLLLNPFGITINTTNSNLPSNNSDTTISDPVEGNNN